MLLRFYNEYDLVQQIEANILKQNLFTFCRSSTYYSNPLASYVFNLQ